jgi:hypothetical protein
MTESADPIPRVRVDFQNADEAGRVRLNTAAAVADIQRQQLELESGYELLLVDAELSAQGRAVFSDDEGIWVAEVGWDEVIPRS